MLVCTFSQSVTSTQTLRSSFSHWEWFQCVRLCHGKHRNISNSRGRIYMTLNIVFFMTSPGRLVVFLDTHTSMGSGPWVLPLIFSLCEDYWGKCSETEAGKCLKEDQKQSWYESGWKIKVCLLPHCFGQLRSHLLKQKHLLGISYLWIPGRNEVGVTEHRGSKLLSALLSFLPPWAWSKVSRRESPILAGIWRNRELCRIVLLPLLVLSAEREKVF